MKKALSLTLLAALFICVIIVSAIGKHAPDTASEILEALGAQNMHTVSVNPEGDNLVSSPASRIEFNSTSYALLDEGDAFVRINRMDEIDELYSQNVNQSSHKAAFTSVKALIDFLEEKIIGSDYELISEKHFDDYTLTLRYERKLSSGAYDTYDSYTILIDENYTELYSLYKQSSDYTEKSEAPVITSSEAASIAGSVLGTDMSTQDYEIELSTVKTNTYFDNSIVPNEIKLAYLIKTDSFIVYVDANTGDIIGGDALKD